MVIIGVIIVLTGGQVISHNRCDNSTICGDKSFCGQDLCRMCVKRVSRQGKNCENYLEDFTVRHLN